MYKDNELKKKNSRRNYERTKEAPKKVDPFKDNDFESVFKVALPVTPVKKGFGYEGVVIRDNKKDELQCHICGKFFKSVSSHVAKVHGIKAKEYKIKYGLPLTFALVSKDTSARLSKHAIDNGYGKKLDPIGASKLAKKASTKNSFHKEYYRKNASFHNKLGICDKQINSRFLICCFLLSYDSGLDRLPKKRDLLAYDPPLESRIVRRYGSYGKYLIKIGNKLFENKSDDSMEYCISIIRAFYMINHKVPTIKDFKRSISDKVLDMFGSWESALVHSGYEKIKDTENVKI